MSSAFLRCFRPHPRSPRSAGTSRTWLAIPPGQACPQCGTTDPDYDWQEVSGAGTVRSWTVIRQSFLPGFDGDLPFLLVDVELAEQGDLRMIGRLLDGPDAPVRAGAAVRVAFEDVTDGVSVPAFTLAGGAAGGDS